MQAVKRLSAIVAIAALYAVSGTLLYRARASGVSPALHSDWLVFGVPALLAFVAFGAAFWRDRQPPRRLVTVGAIAAGLTIATAFAYLFFAFNYYGT